MKMNKKGAVPIVVWIIIAVVGLLLAKQAGLFEIYAPPGTETSPLILVNNYYWGAEPNEATSFASWDCAQNNYIKFRVSNKAISSADAIGDSIAFNNGWSSVCNSNIMTILYENDNTLGSGAYNCDQFLPDYGTGYTKLFNIEDGVITSLTTGSTSVYNAFSLWKKTDSSSNYILCGVSATGGHRYIGFTTSSSYAGIIVSTSPTSVDTNKEMKCNPIYIKDAGKYACSGGNVIKKYCSSFSADNTIIQTCESNQQCKYFTSSETAGLSGSITNNPAVKCGTAAQKWVSNKQLCKEDFSSLFQTTSLGDGISSISCPTNTGGKCVQSTTSAAYCTQCSGTITRCKSGTDKVVQDCSASGTWQDKTTCGGISTCQYNKVSEVYECKSGFTDGQTRCDLNNNKQRQRFDGTSQTWVNLPLCRTLCDTSAPARCTNECTWTGYTGVGSCSLGVLTYCDRNSDTGNIQVNTAPYYQKTCTFGGCKLDFSGCNVPYINGRTYCLQGDSYLKQAVTDTSTDADLLAGSIKLVPVTPQCTLGCTESTPTPGYAKCNLAPKCLSANQRICMGQYEIGTCSANGEVIHYSYCPQGENKFCDDSVPTADATCGSLPATCTGSKGCRDSTIWSCNGGTGPGYWVDQIDDCAGNGCTETTAGKPECNADALCTGYTFSGNFYTCDTSKKSWLCKEIVNQDWDGKQLVRDLTDSLSCTSTSCQVTSNPAQRCVSACVSGTPICVGDEVHDCINSQISSLKWTCERFPILTGPACVSGACVNECGTEPKYAGGAYSCEGTYSTHCEQNSVTGQKILKSEDCTFGCDSGSGRCMNQCTGTSICAADGKIYQCINNLKTETLISDCMGKGCSVLAGQAKCNNDCNPVDVDKSLSCLNINDQVVSVCTGSGCKSVTCKKNAATGQYYNATTSCGISGCLNKKCTGNLQYANSFFCTGNLDQEIYATDSQGVPITFIINCKAGNVPIINNLQPYCKNGQGTCNYCEVNDYYCTASGNSGTQFQCANGVTGAIQNSVTCSAGCGKTESGQPYCDKLTVSIIGSTNFPTIGDTNLGDVDIVGVLKGSVSGRLISGSSVSATITGAGLNENSNTVLSGTDGVFTIPFHSKNVGEYTIVITVSGYSENNVKTLKAVITNSFTISPYESQNIYLIPSISPMFKVKAVNPSTGATPDGLQVSDKGNLTIPNPPKQSSIDPTIWEVTLASNSVAGQYEVGFRPTQGATLLDEQRVQVEIVKPTLTVTTNAPDSTTPGKKEFKIQVSGPRYETGILSTGPMKPDVQPKATVTYNQQTADLALLDNGGGEYLVTYTFANTGTYTMNIEATKAGYTSAIISKQIQISASGTELPPSGGGGGGGGGTTATNQTTIGGIITKVTSGGTGTYVIIGIVLVIGYLIYTRRKKRR